LLDSDAKPPQSSDAKYGFARHTSVTNRDCVFTQNGRIKNPAKIGGTTVILVSGAIGNNGTELVRLLSRSQGIRELAGDGRTILFNE
jgi:hypothetical protein